MPVVRCTERERLWLGRTRLKVARHVPHPDVGALALRRRQGQLGGATGKLVERVEIRR